MVSFRAVVFNPVGLSPMGFSRQQPVQNGRGYDPFVADTFALLIPKPRHQKGYKPHRENPFRI